MNKFKLTKGFCIWFISGIILYLLFMGVFMLLAQRNTQSVDLQNMLKSAEQISADNNRLTTTGNDSKLFFTADTVFKADYLDVRVSDLNDGTQNAQLFYADNEGAFNGENSIRFALANGLNEIKMEPHKFLRLDISDREEVSLKLESVTLRSAKTPLYEIPQSFILFVLAWLMLYFAARRCGICYTGIRESLILSVEAIFAFLMIMTVLYALDGIKYKLAVFTLVPLSVYFAAFAYAKLNTDGISRKLKAAVPAVIVVMTGIMCFVGYKMVSGIFTDLGAVYYSAWDIAERGGVNTLCTGDEAYSIFFEGSNNDYFVRYHNNLSLLGILALFYKLLSLFNLTADSIISNYLSVLLNIAFIMSGVIFGTLTVKNLFGKKGIVVYLIMSGLFVPYYIHACRFYTDSMSMPFVSITLWLYSIPDNKFKPIFIKYALIGISIALGCLIKGSVIVLLAALLIHLILKSIKNIRFAATAIIAVALISGIWGAYTKNCDWVDLSKSDSLEFPITHWIMMGLDRGTVGGYSQIDFEYTDSFPSKAEKQRANIEVIMRRLGEFDSLSELADFEFTKAALAWGDGQYMQDNHIEWGINRNGVYNIVSTSGRFYPVYNIYIVVYAFCMYIFAVAGSILSIKKPKVDFAMFLRLTMLGVILFFMLWESKSRYLFNFTPVFMLAAIYGAEEIKRRIIK